MCSEINRETNKKGKAQAGADERPVLSTLRDILNVTIDAQSLTFVPSDLDEMKVIFMAFVAVMAASHPEDVRDALWAMTSVLEEWDRGRSATSSAL